MNGGKNRQPLGYTIVEVMIVLAISGLMFVLAAGFISGKQAQTSFSAGSNEFRAAVQSVANEVVSGQYSDVDFGCTVTGMGATAVITIADTGSAGKNKNSDCVFIGKLLRFNDGGTSKYAVYPLAASRATTTLADTMAIISSVPPAKVTLTRHLLVPQNLDVTKLTVTDDSGATVDAHAVGFAQSIPGIDSDGNYISGGQSVKLYYTLTAPAVATRLALVHAKTVVICVSDGSRLAEVRIGDTTNGGSEVNVNITVVNSC